MATTLFLRDGIATTHRGDSPGYLPKTVATTRGSGVVAKTTNTAAGPTSGVGLTNGAGGTLIEWISDPLSADLAIDGTITANLWSSESSMNANVAINVEINVLDGATGALTLVVFSTRVTELAVTTRAVNNFTHEMLSTDYVTFNAKRGDRIVIRVFGDDAGTMGGGFTFDLGYAGGTASADGDSFVTFTENFSFESLSPSGSTVYFTDTQSALDDLANTGFLSGGTYESVNRAGSTAWSNPSNAGASDDVYATITLAGEASQDLVCRNLGISLPTGAIIRGLEIKVEVKCSTGTVTISSSFRDETGSFIGAIDNTHAATTTEATYTHFGL